MKKFTGYTHGINLGGWLSQCDHTTDRYENFIKEEDIKTIASWGLDHIRVPVDYDLVETADGEYTDGFKYIDRALEWAGKYGLNMVLDLHKTFGYSFDDGENEEGFFENESYQERFYKLWEEFARRYGSYRDRLCFELLNEVTKKEYCETWNRIARTVIGRIRAIAPDVDILLGGYYNNSIEALKDLEMPMDSHIIYNFHFYEPLIFTHQGGYWVDGMDETFRMPFASTYEDYGRFTEANTTQHSQGYADFDQDAVMDAEYFRRRIGEAVEVAKERDVALYCGEYGAIDRAEPEDRLAWFETVCGVFDEFDIARAAWSYKEMDFGIVDKCMDSVRDKLIQIL